MTLESGDGKERLIDGIGRGFGQVAAVWLSGVVAGVLITVIIIVLIVDVPNDITFFERDDHGLIRIGITRTATQTLLDDARDHISKLEASAAADRENARASLAAKDQKIAQLEAEIGEKDRDLQAAQHEIASAQKEHENRTFKLGAQTQRNSALNNLRYHVVRLGPDKVLPLRADPNPASQILAMIPRGTWNIIDRHRHAYCGRDLWVEVEYAGKVGWVNAYYLAF